MNFQLGLNAYNWLNHANYGAPSSQTLISFGKTILTSSPPTTPYGAFASAATDMRMAKITAKLTFLPFRENAEKKGRLSSRPFFVVVTVRNL